MLAVPPPLPRPAPLPPADRLALLDALRGFAICGILVVNFRYFASDELYHQLLFTFPAVEATADSLIQLGILFFAEGKFIALLAILFGAGFAVIMDKPGLAEPNRLMTRRLLWLGAIGLAHALFIWFGDILAVYAATGLLLIPFRGCAPRTLLRWSLGLFAMWILFSALSGAAASDSGEMEWVHWLWQRAEAVYPTGGWLLVLTQRALEAALGYAFMVFALPMLLAYFLFGAWAWRTGRFARADGFRRIGWAALPVALAGHALLVYGRMQGLGLSPGFDALWMCVYAAAIPAMALSYLAGIQALVAKGSAWVAWLIPIGRMALTNYLMQSVLFTTIFYGYGLGLWGRMGMPAGLALIAATWGLQAVVSAWWLRRFTFGPAERLWRKLSYE
jgi:uncharacterized protein